MDHTPEANNYCMDLDHRTSLDGICLTCDKPMRHKICPATLRKHCWVNKFDLEPIVMVCSDCGYEEVKRTSRAADLGIPLSKCVCSRPNSKPDDAGSYRCNECQGFYSPLCEGDGCPVKVSFLGAYCRTCATTLFCRKEGCFDRVSERSYYCIMHTTFDPGCMVNFGGHKGDPCERCHKSQTVYCPDCNIPSVYCKSTERFFCRDCPRHRISLKYLECHAERTKDCCCEACVLTNCLIPDPSCTKCGRALKEGDSCPCAEEDKVLGFIYRKPDGAYAETIQRKADGTYASIYRKADGTYADTQTTESDACCCGGPVGHVPFGVFCRATPKQQTDPFRAWIK